MLQPRSQYPSMVWPLERSPSRSVDSKNWSVPSGSNESCRLTDENVSQVVEAAAKVIDEDGTTFANDDVEGDLRSWLVGYEILLVARPSILGPAVREERGRRLSATFAKNEIATFGRQQRDDSPEVAFGDDS